jgi:uncharacterized protein (DUF58 family)
MGITKKMALLIWLGIAFLLAGMFLNLSISIFVIYNFIMLALFLFDYKMSPGSGSFDIERVHEGVFEIGREKKVYIRVLNKSRRDAHMQVVDTIPQGMEHSGTPIPLICPARGQSSVDYTLRPTRRGSFMLGSIHVRLKGLLGLCTKSFEIKCSEAIPVYPDLYPMKKYHLMSRSRLLQQDDSSIHKMYGIGTDFQYLREYTTDDEYRKINWNATARSNSLITGVYDVEKNQNIIICIDTDRNMMSMAGGLSRLDHSVQSALVLAQVAIDKGDRVGLLIFGNDVKLFLRPAKGPSQLDKILHAVYSLQSSYYESDFNELVSYLETFQRKRSLVCIFSHPRDEETCKDLTLSLGPLIRKHVVLMVSILNPGIREILHSPVKDQHSAYLKAASAYRLSTEHNASTIMSRMGINSIMAEPERLTPEVVNRYIAVKKAMRIS